MIIMTHARLFLALIFIIQAGQSTLGEISCLKRGNYTINSTYAVNLNKSIQLLHENVDDNGFYNVSVGQGPGGVNAAVLCRGDVQLNECKKCILEGAAELSKSCPLQKQAIRWDVRCMLRYSNAMFYGVLDTSILSHSKNPNNASNPVRFQEEASDLLAKLRDQAAAGGPLRKVAAANVSLPDFQTIFALVQCTPDLSKEFCTRCLLNSYDKIPAGCNRKRGCRVIGPNCNLRFETYSFYNETRLQELQLVAASPPVLVPVPAPAGDPPSRSSGKDDGNSTLIVIIIVVPIALSLMAAVSAIVWLRKRSIPIPVVTDLESDDEISTAESLQYAFITIKTATNDFSDENKLGQGGFGSVYKGILPNGKEIAVKRLSRGSGQGDLEFKNEVLLLAKLQHRNLVRLLGFAIQGMEKLLIYELVQNSSLDHFIFDQGNRSFLDWDRRYKIIGGIARGILYLHEDSRLRIIHRDLKASNILLDREMNPKIADFGMARLFGQDETQGNTSRVVGTYGYMPPEYIIQGQFSTKSDVFSFGVLVLEIISGRRNSNFHSRENGDDLLSFAWKNWREGTAANVVDPILRSGTGSMSEMMRCIHIGLLCVQENAGERPTMASIVVMLSSSSMSLALPSEPAFYLPSVDISRIDHYDSRGTESVENSKRPGDQSDHSSNNGASITELHPRCSRIKINQQTM